MVEVGKVTPRDITPEELARELQEELEEGLFIPKKKEAEKEIPKERKTLAETLGITPKSPRGARGIGGQEKPPRGAR